MELRTTVEKKPDQMIIGFITITVEWYHHGITICSDREKGRNWTRQI